MKINIKLIKTIITLAYFVTFVSCYSNKYSKENHIGTEAINSGLYFEVYKTYTGSATTSDSYSYYITDSIHFRKFIGEENYDNERIIWYYTNDLLTVYRKTRNYNFKTETVDNSDSSSQSKIELDALMPIITYDSVLIGKYNINQLIKEGEFE